MIKKVLIIASLLIGFIGCALADNPQSKQQSIDIRLLAEYSKIYQLWLTAQDYRYGATVKKNPLLASAWLYNYLNSLPMSYPSKETLLKPFYKSLSKAQIKNVPNLASQLQKKYKLTNKLDEADLTRIIQLKNKRSLSDNDSRAANIVGTAYKLPIDSSVIILQCLCGNSA